MLEDRGSVGRAAAIVTAGHRGDVTPARAAWDDPGADPACRVAALGALARNAADGRSLLTESLLLDALADDALPVRRRAIECSATADASGAVDERLSQLAESDDEGLAEAAVWALGERHGSELSEASGRQAVVLLLVRLAGSHPDALCREAAVAALGGIGDAAGLEAVLSACGDRATIRRRAAVALAAFDGPEVDAALQRLRTDRDWQVRQVAEDLLRSAVSDGP